MFLLITSWWMGCEDEWIVLSALGKSGMLVGTTRRLLSSERALKPDDGDRTTAKSLSHGTFLYHSHIYFCFFPPLLWWQRELDNLGWVLIRDIKLLGSSWAAQGVCTLSAIVKNVSFFPVLLQLALCPSKSGVRDGFFLCCTVINLNVVSLDAFMVLGDAVYLTLLNFISG